MSGEITSVIYSTRRINKTLSCQTSIYVNHITENLNILKLTLGWILIIKEPKRDISHLSLKSCLTRSPVYNVVFHNPDASIGHSVFLHSPSDATCIVLRWLHCYCHTVQCIPLL